MFIENTFTRTGIQSLNLKTKVFKPSTEVAFLLLIQQPRVRFWAFLKFYFSMLPRFTDGAG